MANGINPNTGRPIGEASRRKYSEMKGEIYAPALSGSAVDFRKAAGNGGATADDMKQWTDSFMAANWDGNAWTNGYSGAMNERSIKNAIRQQMEANSKGWFDADDAGKEYLHAQNTQLAALLNSTVGGGGNTRWNESAGRWETDDGDVGYGYNWGAVFDPEWKQSQYGQTPEQMESYANDTNRYYNYVSQSGKRNWVDESGGYTGKYAQFLYGPYGQLLGESTTGYVNPATYTDLVGDGFNDEAYWTPVRDAEGNIIAQPPALKGNNNLTDYTRSKAAYVDEYGIIQPGVLNGTKSKTAGLNMWLNGGIPVADPGENYGVTWRTPVTAHTRLGVGINDEANKMLGLGQYAGGGVDSYEEYINNLYDASLASNLSQLDQAYAQAVAELEASQRSSASQYNDAKIAAAGAADRDAAANREVANAQGVSSGAIGQTALTDAGYAAAQMDAMNAAQAQAMADIETQKAVIAQTYRQQIQQAEADNDYERAQALFAEAQRVDEALRQQQQNAAQNNYAYMQLMMGG